ncbi:MAG: hypothetical protein H6899_12425 [Rhodobacter sp.]|nr:hypothetical protein [Rhodobacter sp.]
MASPSEETWLIRHLYRAASAPASDWMPALAALCDTTRADGAVLLIEAAGAVHRLVAGDPPPLPPPETLRRLRDERIHGRGDLDMPGPPLRLIAVTVHADSRAWLAIGQAQTEFRAADGALLARVSPHLAQAVELWLARQADQAATRQTALLSRALGAGWLWLDPALRVIEADATAQSLIDETPGLRLAPGGRLDPADTQVGRDLRRALDQAIAGRAHCLTLTRDRAALQMIVLPGLTAPAPGLRPVVRAVLRRAPRASAMDPGALAAVLGLSRSEARLAALICDGATLAEAAETLGWTLETTRSCSKRVFAQTGARGQPDLVRLMQTGTAWFAP